MEMGKCVKPPIEIPVTTRPGFANTVDQDQAIKHAA